MRTRRRVAFAAALALGLQALLAPAQALAALAAFASGAIDADQICFAPGARERAPVPSPAGTAHVHHCILCPGLDAAAAVLPPGQALGLPPDAAARIDSAGESAVVVAPAFHPPSRAPPPA